MIIRSAYDRANLKRVSISFPKGSSMTHQSFKDSCDINRIINTYMRTGVLPEATSQPFYGDFTDTSYQESLNTVIDAQTAFAALPAVVRKRFNGDPLELLQFVSDPSNLDEAVKLGLAIPPEVEIPAPAPKVHHKVEPPASSASAE